MPAKPKTCPRKTSTLVIQIASAIGVLDATYLAYVKIAKAPIYFTPGLGDCVVVNASRWSVFLGIPLGIYGVAGFSLIFLLVTLNFHTIMTQQNLDLTLFGISLTGFLFSVYLTAIEIFVIKSVCQWCLLSALAMSVIFFTTIARLVVKSPTNIASGGNQNAKN